MPVVTPLSTLLSRYKRAFRWKRPNSRRYSTIRGDIFSRRNTLYPGGDRLFFLWWRSHNLHWRTLQLGRGYSPSISLTHAASCSSLSRHLFIHQHTIARAFEANACFLQYSFFTGFHAGQKEGFEHRLCHLGTRPKFNDRISHFFSTLLNLLINRMGIDRNLGHSMDNLITLLCRQRTMHCRLRRRIHTVNRWP